MAKQLQGKPVVEALNFQLRREAEELKKRGIIPTLCILRVGEREDDIAYERSAQKRAEASGVQVKNCQLAANISQETLLAEIHKLNQDDSIHGVLLFRPLPAHLSDGQVCGALAAEKDVDGITGTSMAGVYAGSGQGFPPCTPSACMEILKHYNIDVAGKKAVVVGRSLVVGKPAAMMLLERNATVTICHTKTRNLPATCQEADILLVAAGKARSIGVECMRQGQIILDVGIHVDENGRLCGDVDDQAAESLAEAVTPVPGGVGMVTASILMEHVIQAAKKQTQEW